MSRQPRGPAPRCAPPPSGRKRERDRTEIHHRDTETQRKTNGKKKRRGQSRSIVVVLLPSTSVSPCLCGEFCRIFAFSLPSRFRVLKQSGGRSCGHSSASTGTKSGAAL